MRDTTPHLLAGLLVLSVSACKDDPSFRLRWDLAGENVDDPFQCSERGVLTVTALTLDASGRRADVRRFPCFPQSFEEADGRVSGPTLPEGPYAVKLLGTNRAFTPWIDEVTLAQERVSADLAGLDYDEDAQFDTCRALVESPSCRAEELVCDCKHVDVREDETIDLGTFELGPTPQCSDGIDNDRDGLVDGNDPACGEVFSLDTVEGRNVAASEFDVRVSFLDGNDAADCRDVGVASIEVRVGDEVLAQTSSCDLSLRFSSVLDASKADGPAVDGLLPVTLTVHALDTGGEPVAAPQMLAVEVPESFGGFFVLQADFPADAFIEPISSRARFTVSYEGFEGGPTRGCEAVATSGGGRLTIASVRLTFLDAHGRPLDPPPGLDDGTLADGSPRPCPGGMIVTAAPLEWGDYLVAVEALSPEGDVCFANLDAPARAAPGDTVGFVVPRISASGSCRDCDTDADCTDQWSCVDGVCRL